MGKMDRSELSREAILMSEWMKRDESFGAFIKRMRLLNHWTLETMSERCGLAISTLSEIENDYIQKKEKQEGEEETGNKKRKTLRDSTIEALAKGLDIEEDILRKKIKNPNKVWHEIIFNEYTMDDLRLAHEIIHVLLASNAAKRKEQSAEKGTGSRKELRGRD